MTIAKPKNIYYMLSYAYNILREGAFREVDSEDFENIHNLFAEIIALGVSNQIKRGLNREYEEYTESIGTVRGKISINNSFFGLTQKSNKLVCTFDEYTSNSPMNQVIKSTMYLLIHSDEVKPDKKIRLKSLIKYFSEVELVDPHTINWQSFQYHRNNATYRMLMNLCYLVHSGMILSDSTGKKKLSEYIDGQQMHALYERFILEYFKKHHREFGVSRPVIKWNLDEGEAGNLIIDFLPNMYTDITLQYEDRILIIDAKYYKEILSCSQYSSKGKYKSANLYQIFTYVKNMDTQGTGNVEGMLLYAKTEQNAPDDMSVLISGNRIHVKTLDLSDEWDRVTEKLELIARDFKSNDTLVRENRIAKERITKNNPRNELWQKETHS
jgi:5-methylcytosine-specific restriction enzyme subunit McrC